MPDISCVCKDCKNQFICDEKEQDFMRQQFADFKVPTRCVGCRRIAREKRNAQATPGSSVTPPSRPLAPAQERNPPAKESYGNTWGDKGYGRQRSRRDYSQD